MSTSILSTLEFAPLQLSDLSVLMKYFPEVSPGNHRRRLTKKQPDDFTYAGLKINDGELVATVFIRKTGPTSPLSRALSNAPEIAALYVRPEYRGQGFGRHMLDKCETMLAKEGFTEAGLAVRISNQTAMKLYESKGYLIVGDIEPSAVLPSEPRVYMLKKLVS